MHLELDHLEERKNQSRKPSSVFEESVEFREPLRFYRRNTNFLKNSSSEDEPKSCPNQILFPDQTVSSQGVVLTPACFGISSWQNGRFCVDKVVLTAILVTFQSIFLNSRNYVTLILFAPTRRPTHHDVKYNRVVTQVFWHPSTSPALGCNACKNRTCNTFSELNFSVLKKSFFCLRWNKVSVPHKRWSCPNLASHVTMKLRKSLWMVKARRKIGPRGPLNQTLAERRKLIRFCFPIAFVQIFFALVRAGIHFNLRGTVVADLSLQIKDVAIHYKAPVLSLCASLPDAVSTPRSLRTESDTPGHEKLDYNEMEQKHSRAWSELRRKIGPADAIKQTGIRHSRVRSAKRPATSANEEKLWPEIFDRWCTVNSMTVNTDKEVSDYASRKEYEQDARRHNGRDCE
jgi:hypothetical protein